MKARPLPACKRASFRTNPSHGNLLGYPDPVRKGCALHASCAGCRGPNPVNPPNDCLRCGVCCFSRLETFVLVTGEDWERLGADAARVARFTGHRAYMK